MPFLIFSGCFVICLSLAIFLCALMISYSAGLRFLFFFFFPMFFENLLQVFALWLPWYLHKTSKSIFTCNNLISNTSSRSLLSYPNILFSVSQFTYFYLVSALKFFEVILCSILLSRVISNLPITTLEYSEFTRETYIFKCFLITNVVCAGWRMFFNISCLRLV